MRHIVAFAILYSSLLVVPRGEAFSASVAPGMSSVLSAIKTKIDRYETRQYAKRDYAAFLKTNPALKQIQDSKFNGYGGGMTKAFTLFGRGSAILNIGVGILTNNTFHIGSGLAMIAPSEVMGATTRWVRRVARTETLQFAKDKMQPRAIEGLTPERLARWQGAGIVGTLK